MLQPNKAGLTKLDLILFSSLWYSVVSRNHRLAGLVNMCCTEFSNLTLDDFRDTEFQTLFKQLPFIAIKSCQQSKLLNMTLNNEQKCLWLRFLLNIFFLTCALPNPAFMLRASAALLDEPVVSPTLAPSSAPRTETTTVAPASVPNWHLEVRHFLQFLPLIFPCLNLSLCITHLVKHFCPPLVNVLKCISFSLCANIKLLLTYSCTYGCYILWAWIQLIQTFLLNSLALFLSRLVVWGLWSIQPEWQILPQHIQCGSLQWY